MYLGFIGTGEITKAVVKGILNSKIKYTKIYLSRRNKNISKYLSRKSKKIVILDDNQKIIDKSNWVFLSITPAVGNKIIKKYQFKKSQTIISFISTIKYNDLKKYIKTKCILVRAIPLPPISMGVGPIPIYPPNKKSKDFF